MVQALFYAVVVIYMDVDNGWYRYTNKLTHQIHNPRRMYVVYVAAMSQHNIHTSDRIIPIKFDNELSYFPLHINFFVMYMYCQN